MSANNFTGTNPTGATHTTTGAANPTTTSTTTGGNKGAEVGQGLKGLFAKGHGIGESIRGNINGAIDGFTGDNASLAKNEQVARGGEQEFRTGDFVKKGTTDKAL
ncbi:hypothetical protein AUEXF2481DRAFT_81254 [Aureobasidium subglaciale EXF-2481]|uniref:Uncharacterized protein n=1 Tax=Aureobasidium subglaciale (strain EXF-2481) TaxID=1043005 RepID=A0A074Z342_AURSE|nr:uncharacterized protein AUEXF2481DRAFT_81254 [Aureobasidium subglaciale EXF-2481]KAI5212908.1 hypothetical protein E4T38_00215 [Aureobasidium subglaciale]KAI5232427.1 hypothetical protein E4T40_00214 [Aureobasidium subglaciale]KAI5234862.1 hypothetical protein E4T41_00214 [Aureobasidium subglaciale]KAI5246144.1 hypothetical protein E4T43_02785 [Aureobasidium subglaciale]KAI5268424.1 hypothetical protein E4T46_00214 [Aureobasidium subglaciale]